ncbi:hypothetical protein DFA_05761 [Cavenderia fasciculata]|uniref:Transmembrane protein n=1 Tax=Cavenderia fasciculata TaxID=261658 RepID=F4PMI0_CACFS|nr:uncharacterized protein DFA_05761 [Cavenderia fasciculata]EGG23627.1 hypothetical protein DFA_05761 [Cavenderia fasciculata]|eukprot:XP_004361478.1 hypothetical protein DFA_05761 [Cavenderia fasciculata]
MVYFIVMFFTWISFYDLNLPGCSKIQIIFFFLCYIGVSIAWLSVVTKIKKEDNRLAYSFIDAIVIAFCAVCYLIHVIIHKFKKQYVYGVDDVVVDERGVKRRKRRSKPWTKRLSKILCYYKLIDMDEDDQKNQIARDIMTDVTNARDASLPHHNSVNVTEASGNPSDPNFFRHSMYAPREEKHVLKTFEGGGIEMATIKDQSSTLTSSQERDAQTEFFKKKKGASETGGDISSRTQYTGQLRISPSVMDELMPKYETSFRNYICTVVYQIAVVATWFWLHNFATLVIEKDLFSTPFLALLSIVLFHASRLMLMGVSNILNRLLSPRELTYFTFFQFPLMFFLYYRNLFLNINSWGITVLVSLVLFVFDIAYYPLHMTKRYWIFRHQQLAIYLEKRGTTSRIFRWLRVALDDPNPSYEQHICKLSVEYYYDKMAEYTSIVTMVVFLSLIRALKYKISYYPSFEELDTESFHQLLFRYLYLVCFEMAYDLGIRFFARRFMKIDISNRGRNETISHFTTRFIYTFFLLYCLMDVYNAQVIYNDNVDFSSTDDTISNSLIANIIQNFIK